MRLVFGEDERVARWASRQFGPRMGAFSAGFVQPFIAIGIQNEAGDLTGASILNNYDGRDIEITVIGRGMISRGAFRALASYVFDQLRCVRVSATVRSDNASILRMAGRLGFKREGLIRKKYGACDAVVLGLLKEECKNWIRDEITASTRAA